MFMTDTEVYQAQTKFCLFIDSFLWTGRMLVQTYRPELYLILNNAVLHIYLFGALDLCVLISSVRPKRMAAVLHML